MLVDAFYDSAQAFAPAPFLAELCCVLQILSR